MVRATRPLRGYRMPAEWEPHRATWLVWPHNRDDFEVKTAAVEWCYTEIIRHLTASERVALVTSGPRSERRARRMLTQSHVPRDRIEWHRIPTNRSWIRDAGPIFVTREGGRRTRLAVTDWRFNGWARYRAWQRDNAIPRLVSERLGVPRFEIEHEGRPFVLEGGSIDVNGEGLLLTTEECLLSPVQGRNPGVSRRAVEGVLKAALGVARVLWLGRGIEGDDTHGHVDDIARFVGPRTVVAAVEADRSDENYAALRDNRRRLDGMTSMDGAPLRVVTLPMPRRIEFDGQRLPASYLNFYIANSVVLVPTFNDPSDRVALSRLARLFKNRKVIGIHAVDLVLGRGTLHCLTQQEPEAPGRRTPGGTTPSTPQASSGGSVS